MGRKLLNKPQKPRVRTGRVDKRTNRHRTGRYPKLSPEQRRLCLDKKIQAYAEHKVRTTGKLSRKNKATRGTMTRDEEKCAAEQHARLSREVMQKRASAFVDTIHGDDALRNELLSARAELERERDARMHAESRLAAEQGRIEQYHAWAKELISKISSHPTTRIC